MNAVVPIVRYPDIVYRIATNIFLAYLVYTSLRNIVGAWRKLKEMDEVKDG